MTNQAYPYQTNFEQHLKREGLASVTIDQYHADLRALFDHLMHVNVGFAADPQLTNVFEGDVRDYLAYRLANHTINPNTYNKTLSHLNNYFKYAFSHHLMQELPTLTMHGKQLSKPTNVSVKWLDELGEIVEDGQLSFYTRLTLLLINQGFTASEFLQPGFYETFAKLQWKPFERQFIRAYQRFIKPLQSKQQSHDLFLKQRLDLEHPQLSLPALHKYLSADGQRLGFSLSPQALHQAFIIVYLQRHEHQDNNTLANTLRLTPQSLRYYQKLQQAIEQ
ncbi:MAG TPA: hypothetical protein DCW31_09160 [Lactobacillus sp.]|nr:hypothetical protein [Lactobacillus sp.]